MVPSRASRRVNGHEAEAAVVEDDLDNDARRSSRGHSIASTSYDEHTAADGDIMNNGDGEGSDVRRALRRLCTAMARATMVGGVLKGGINTFGLLARARKQKGHDRAATSDAIRDTAAFAAFLATFAGVYVGMDEGLAMRFGKQRSKGWRAAVAGGLAGPALLLASGPHTGVGRSRSVSGRGGGGGGGTSATAGQRHYGLATYIWLRSLVLIVRCGLKREAEAEAERAPLEKGATTTTTTTTLRRTLLAPFASGHADTGLMMVSATVILSCFINKPEALQGAYGSFLNKHGGKTVGHYRAVQGVCLSQSNRETSERVAYAARMLYADDPDARDALLAAAASCASAASRGVPLDDPAMRALRAKLYGMILYPGQSAASHWLEFFANSLERSFAVNLPIYLVPSVLVHREKLLGKRGPGLMWRAAIGCARSSAFLSAYCATAWLGPAMTQRVVGDMRWWTLTAGVPAAGLAVILEKPSRRQELGVYCASRALEAAALCAVSWGWVPARVQRWRHDVALFALASAAIMHCYNAERDVFRSKYLNVLDFVFGNTGHGRQRIRHIGSFAVLANPPQMASPPPPPPAHAPPTTTTTTSSSSFSSADDDDTKEEKNTNKKKTKTRMRTRRTSSAAAACGDDEEDGGGGAGGDGKRATLKTLLNSPERRKRR